MTTSVSVNKEASIHFPGIETGFELINICLLFLLQKLWPTVRVHFPQCSALQLRISIECHDQPNFNFQWDQIHINRQCTFGHTDVEVYLPFQYLKYFWKKFLKWNFDEKLIRQRDENFLLKFTQRVKTFLGVLSGDILLKIHQKPFYVRLVYRL